MTAQYSRFIKHWMFVRVTLCQTQACTHTLTQFLKLLVLVIKFGLTISCAVSGNKKNCVTDGPVWHKVIYGLIFQNTIYIIPIPGKLFSLTLALYSITKVVAFHLSEDLFTVLFASRNKNKKRDTGLEEEEDHLSFNFGMYSRDQTSDPPLSSKEATVWSHGFVRRESK